MTYNFPNYAAIGEAAAKEMKRANAERNQDSYNTAWLRGYACALYDAQYGLDAGSVETARAIVECFETLLEQHGIIIPDDDRPADNDTPLYGSAYGDLMEHIVDILKGEKL